MITSHNITPHSWLAHAAAQAAQYRSQHLKTSQRTHYCGRFAPSPSGALHQGSLVTALASYLHARWHGGSWRLRIEDVDTARCTRSIADEQIQLLRDLGFVWDGDIVWQSERFAAYRHAFDILCAQQRVYPCYCTRQHIQQVQQMQQQRHLTSTHYPKICTPHHAPDTPYTFSQHIDKSVRSWRFHAHNTSIHWQDTQNRQRTDCVDDFVLKRGGYTQEAWTYALAVVIDDAQTGITHVVRGEDIIPATARQIALQQALHLPTPQYTHVPLVLTAQGHKLSKRDQAPALNTLSGLSSLMHAWVFLGGREFDCTSVSAFWQHVLPPPTQPNTP